MFACILEPDADQCEYASVDTGFIGHNVYFLCASEGVVDSPKLGQTLKLPDQQFINFAQTAVAPTDRSRSADPDHRIFDFSFIILPSTAKLPYP
ncbi:hypothetical protein BH10PLA2_BH10PLA2_35560 [soil metagenome]